MNNPEIIFSVQGGDFFDTLYATVRTLINNITVVEITLSTDDEYLEIPKKSLSKKEKKEILGHYFQVKKNDEKLNEQCSICLEKYKYRKCVRTLGCNHYFHKVCIDKNIFKYNNNTCPICRYDIFQVKSS